MGRLLFLSENCLNEVFGHAVETEFGYMGKKKKKGKKEPKEIETNTFKQSEIQRQTDALAW